MVLRLPDPARLRGHVGIALLAGVACWSGCGPSFEVLAEGDLRFVHCDRLDLDPKIAPSHRLHCWREWRRMYTYGQTRDRVEYAARRIAEVVSGDTESPFQLPEGEAVTGRHRVRPAVKLDAVSSAPAERASAGGAPAAAVVSASGPSPDELACRNRCEAANVECSPGCETRPTGCKLCQQPLEACLGDCKPATPPAAPRGPTKEQRP